jgi:hypothetical protein
VAARVAAQGWQAQETAEEGGGSGDVFGRDFLQLGIAAQAAMRVERKAEWDRAGVEARFTLFAAPGQYPGCAQQIVRERASLGAAQFGGMAAGAGDRQCKWLVILPLA